VAAVLRHLQFTRDQIEFNDGHPLPTSSNVVTSIPTLPPHDVARDRSH
jgi:hypothetical protein